VLFDPQGVFAERLVARCAGQHAGL
jgi:hypothetical protein